jgi:hypothetical protein
MGITITGNIYELRRIIRLIPGPIEIVEKGKRLGRGTIQVDFIVTFDYSVDQAGIRAIYNNQSLQEFVYRLIVFSVIDRENWKKPNKGAFQTSDELLAVVLLNGLVHYFGGAYLIEGDDGYYYVWSRGYYYYVGV